MERGASIVHETLQELIGLGLDEQEIEYLIQEQTNLLESEEDEEYKIVLAGPFREWSEDCAAGLSEALQCEIIATTTRELSRHADADFVLVPYRHVRSVLPDLPNADVIGLQAELAGDALEQVSRLLERETLGIVTRYPDAIGPLTTSLRETTGFGGQILAVSVGDGDTHLDPLLQQSELVLFTEAASRVSKAAISKATRSLPLAFAVTSDSVDRLRKLVPH
jgi:GntR family transcriptional regulator